MSNRRIIYYYQTFSGLTSIHKQDTPVTHIHLSAIHFGNNPDGSPYIHLNNYPPDDKRFDSVWNEITIAHNLGIKIVLMMGGSGSAFTDLFNNFDVYISHFNFYDGLSGLGHNSPPSKSDKKLKKSGEK